MVPNYYEKSNFPFQLAVKDKISLIVWGEHGFAELMGLVTLEDMVEFTKWTRQEHDRRGFEPYDLITPESGITEKETSGKILKPVILRERSDRRI